MPMRAHPPGVLAQLLLFCQLLHALVHSSRGTVKTLIVPDEEKKGQKFNLTSVYDLEQYNDLLHKTLARYM